jgi:hypothetical protein
MVPWILLQLIASPVSGVMFVKSRQGHMLALTSVGAFLRIGSLVVVDQVIGSYHAETFAVSSALFYAICLVVFMKIAGIGKSKCAWILGLVLSSIALYTAASVAILYLKIPGW